MLQSIRAFTLAAIGALATCTPAALAQSSAAFTYQGRIEIPGAPPVTTADFRFYLCNSPTENSFVFSPIFVNSVPVDHGLFTATLDFTSKAFSDGKPKWLRIDVRSPGGSGSYTTLSPRQPVTPAPLAAGLSGIAITPPGALVLDQAQGPLNSNIASADDVSQTFQAGFSGQLALAEFTVGVAGPNATLEAFLHAGGADGPVIGSGSVSGVNNGIIGVALSNAYVEAGRSYTFTFGINTIISLQASSQQIPGASGETSSGPFNLFFRTYVATPASIDALAPAAKRAFAADSVEWNAVSGVPPTVSGAFSPWAEDASNIRFTTGNVGIGPVEPAAPLHVSSTGNITTNIESSAPGGTWLNLRNSSAGGTYWRLISTGANNGEGAGKLLIGAGPSPGSNVPMATFQNNGNVGIGTISPTQRLHVNGNVLANNVAVPSSIRFKDRVEPMDDALANLLKLSGVRFDWKPEYAKARPGREHDIGFVAEDVEKIFPEVVFRDEEGNVTGMDYSRLTAVAIEAIKQQHALVASKLAAFESELSKRDAQNAAKQNEIDDLKARLERLEKLAK